jgi:hypothetical protein
MEAMAALLVPALAQEVLEIARGQDASDGPNAIAEPAPGCSMRGNRSGLRLKTDRSSS